jgi:hypothetical protein
VGLVVGGVGVAGLVVGAVAGLDASATWNNAKKECTSTATCGSGSRAQNDRDGAQSAATVATVAFAAGGAALATGAILFFTSPHAMESPSDPQAARGAPSQARSASVRWAPEFGIGVAGLTVRGEF